MAAARKCRLTKCIELTRRERRWSRWPADEDLKAGGDSNCTIQIPNVIKFFLQPFDASGSRYLFFCDDMRFIQKMGFHLRLPVTFDVAFTFFLNRVFAVCVKNHFQRLYPAAR